jgi:hypothetical protein
MLTVIVVTSQPTLKPHIQWMLVSLKDVPITACEQENNAKILIICPLLGTVNFQFFYSSPLQNGQGACNFIRYAFVMCVLLL